MLSIVLGTLFLRLPSPVEHRPFDFPGYRRSQSPSFCSWLVKNLDFPCKRQSSAPASWLLSPPKGSCASPPPISLDPSLFCLSDRFLLQIIRLSPFFAFSSALVAPFLLHEVARIRSFAPTTNVPPLWLFLFSSERREGLGCSK